MAAAHRPSRPRASESLLTVDLGRICDNYRALRARVPGAGLAAVVKADAYGLGAAQVGPALAAAGASEFFVAALGEGAALRAAIKDSAAIYVLNGLLPGEADEFIARRLVPVLNDLGQIDAWARAARTLETRLASVVHIDTGMSRLGLTPAEAHRLAAAPDRLAGLDLRYVMSHLACADEPAHPLNEAQLRGFRAIRARFPASRASLANSSGIFLGPRYHFDLARPGAALYGINPTPGHANPQVQVARLEAKILQIREVDPPGSVGYGATYRLHAKARIATIAAGYADGWLRTLAERGSAFYGDIRLPVIGRVSMDLITLDATPAPAARPGDGVELLGERLPVDDVAAAAGTNGYEVLARLGPRFHRVYIDAPAAA